MFARVWSCVMFGFTMLCIQSIHLIPQGAAELDELLPDVLGRGRPACLHDRHAFWSNRLLPWILAFFRWLVRVLPNVRRARLFCFYPPSDVHISW